MDANSDFETYYRDTQGGQWLGNYQCWSDKNECYSIEDYDQCRKRSDSERESCKPTDMPFLPDDFRTCYKEEGNATSGCYTYSEWKTSSQMLICVEDNEPNESYENSWLSKGWVTEQTIIYSIVAVLVLAGLFVGSYYGCKQLKQNEGIQNQEQLL